MLLTVHTGQLTQMAPNVHRKQNIHFRQASWKEPAPNSLK